LPPLAACIRPLPNTPKTQRRESLAFFVALALLTLFPPALQFSTLLNATDFVAKPGS
jgi:hypothetical protein